MQAFVLMSTPGGMIVCIIFAEDSVTFRSIIHPLREWRDCPRGLLEQRA
ncbi:unnamed protein product [Larinioides sclopetarius]|uniref:Uncharacterized protein n=1 Tax=Larinioides sclopetarius TaxID=280406 RepID=A0AAV1Z0B4_9ARAC